MTVANNQLEDLRDRLGAVIRDYCNTIGCKNCGLKYGFDENSECSATDLQGKIMDIEMQDYK